MNLRSWAHKWAIPLQAVLELEEAMGTLGGVASPGQAPDGSESFVQSQIRLEAPHYGVWLTRNNVGCLMDNTGRPVRYGLANESAAQNKVIKSGDLIGIRPVTIQPHHVGSVIGQFVSREVKKVGWQYTGSAHEIAQRNWVDFIISKGGDAAFASGPGSFKEA